MKHKEHPGYRQAFSRTPSEFLIWIHSIPLIKHLQGGIYNNHSSEESSLALVSGSVKKT